MNSKLELKLMLSGYERKRDNVILQNKMPVPRLTPIASVAAAADADAVVYVATKSAFSADTFRFAPR